MLQCSKEAAYGENWHQSLPFILGEASERLVRQIHRLTRSKGAATNHSTGNPHFYKQRVYSVTALCQSTVRIHYCRLQGLFNNHPWPAQRQTPSVLPNRHTPGKGTRHMWCFSWCHSLEQAVSPLTARPITAYGNCTARSDAEEPLSLPWHFIRGGVWDSCVYDQQQKS